MQSELSWLIEIFQTENISKKVQGRFLDRIKTIADNPVVGYSSVSRPAQQINIPPHLAGQSPSTIANLMKEPGQPAPPIPASAQVETQPMPGVIAATPATAVALESRNAAIRAGMIGKPEQGRTSPRKF